MAPRRKRGQEENRGGEKEKESTLMPPRTDSIGLGIGSSRASLPLENEAQDRGTRIRPPQKGLETLERASPSSPPSPSPSSRRRSTSKLKAPSDSLLTSSPGRRMSEPGTTSASGRRPSTVDQQARSVSSGSKRRRTGSDVGIAESSKAALERESLPPSSSRDSEKRAQDRLETGRASGSRLSVEELNSRRYILRVIQSPTTGSAFGTNLLARLALAPPLVVELVVTDSNGNEIPALDELSHLVCHVALLTDTGQAADLLSPVSTPSSSPTNTNTSGSNPTPPSRRASLARKASRRTSGGSSRSRSSGESQRSAPETPSGPLRMLYGTLVASPQQLYTPDSALRCLFLFPEVSVRARGRYRLQVTLMRIPLAGTDTPESSPTLATVITAPFQVVLSVEFVAPHITTLTHHLAQQGVGLLLPPAQLEE